MVTELFNRVKDSIKEMNKYQPGKSIDEIKKQYNIKEIIKMSSNENPLGYSRQVIDAMQEFKELVNRYPDSDCQGLKTALSDFYSLSKDKIFIGNGSDEIIDLIMSLYVDKGDQVVFADPSFIKYQLAVKTRGAKGIKVPLTDDNVHNLDQMAKAVTKKTKVIFICDPNNPTGTIVEKKQVEKFLDKIPSHVLIVVDQAYNEYVTDSNYFKGIDYLNKYPNLILLRTFSKIYGLAGLRIGYGLGNPQVIDLLNRIRSPFNVNTLAQMMAEAALSDQDHVKECKNKNIENKKYLYKKLDNLSVEYIPTQGNFMLINTKMNAKKAFNELLKKGIIVRPGDIFGLPTWIRVTIGCNGDNEKFISALKFVLSKRGKQNDCCNEKR